jgi:lipopolysaccharide heptosyltransferase I
LRLTDLRNTEFSRILLIKPSAVGDVIHALPVLAKLRARYPSARIDWMLTPQNAELVKGHPALSNVVLFARQAYGRPWRDWSSVLDFAGMLAQLRGAKYDLVIDLHGQIRSGAFALVTGAPTRIGFDRPRKSVLNASRKLPEQAMGHAWKGAREGAWVAYTHRIPIPTLDAHAIDRYMWLGEMLGFGPDEPDFTLPIPAEAEEGVGAMLAGKGLGGRPLALLTPGTVWETKHWLPENFAAVGRHFIQSGWDVVLAGAPRDRAVCAVVARDCDGAVDLCGKTSLPQLASLVRRAGICITNDSGPMHLAAALGTPLVAVFGPTDPVWVGPYGQARSVVRVGLACSPCYLRKLRECPYDHACMKQVSAEMVIARAHEVLGQEAVAVS